MKKFKSNIIFFSVLLLCFFYSLRQGNCGINLEIYSGNDISGIEKIVKNIKNPSESWRIEANERINKHRKALINLCVKDKSGEAISEAKVRIKLVRHAFRFGGVMSAKQLSGIDKIFNTDPEIYKQVFLQFFNFAGFGNALKYKLRKGYESLVPPILDWCKENNIPVRGHTLIWPGWGHMPKESFVFKEGKDKAGLKAFCEKQIIAYAEKWDVVEWDVINETRKNHDVQDILGHKIIADWFKLARKQVRNKGAGLYLNENRVISAWPNSEFNNTNLYAKEVQLLLDNGAPITGLGFQSRFKGDNSPEEIYRRLKLFDRFDLDIAATEFEVKYKSEPDRAAYTEMVMTVYFSHSKVVSITAWTFHAVKPGEKDKFLNQALVMPDFTPKLNGKIWLYLTKKHWNTDKVILTDSNGKAKLRGFLGDYVLEIEHKGKTSTKKFALDNDGEQIELTL